MFIPGEPTLDFLVRGFVLAMLGLLAITVMVRISGLRSFSKMTSTDFVMTVAMGSLLAGFAQATDWNQVLQVLAAMAGLFTIQYVIAKLRLHSDRFEKVIENEPILLVEDGRFFEDALKKTRVAKADIYAKLRKADVSDMGKVRAVVLETTGDITVLKGDEPADEILREVRRPEEHPRLD
jgi:uncharacterized membrane protein YcaP (DUF421 family)